MNSILQQKEDQIDIMKKEDRERRKKMEEDAMIFELDKVKKQEQFKKMCQNQLEENKRIREFQIKKELNE